MQQHKTTLTLAICAALGSAPAAAATFEVTSNADAGAGSLRQALVDSNANAEADTINMSSISGQTINLTSGELFTSTDDITINGAGVTIDAGGSSRVLLSYYTDLTLNNVTLTNGSADGYGGGGIASYSGDLTLNNTTITANSASGEGGIGGGIYATSGNLTLNNSTITSNTAPVGGGVVHYTYDGSTTLNASSISGNTAYYQAGGLLAYAYDGIDVIDSSITGNSTLEVRTGAPAVSLPRLAELALPFAPSGGVSGVGGAFLLSSSGDDITIQRSTISGNSAPGDIAGGLFAYTYGNVTVDSSTIANNQAGYIAGAAIYAYYQSRISNSTISGNAAETDVGGLVVLSRNETIIEYTTVTNNTAVNQNAGVYMYGYGDQSIIASVISGNTAASDADLFIEDVETPGIVDMSFSLLGVDPTTGTLNKDAVSISLTGQDPVLGPLANNGGPTLTHLPGASSPLLNTIPSGSAGCGVTITADQRGESRPAEGACDIGSVEEVQGNALPPPAAVPTLSRLGLLLMAGLLGLCAMLGWRRSELERAG